VVRAYQVSVEMGLADHFRQERLACQGMQAEAPHPEMRRKARAGSRHRRADSAVASDLRELGPQQRRTR
jgi:hypothetical protein